MSLVGVRRVAVKVLVGAALLAVLWTAWALIDVVRAGVDARAGEAATDRARTEALTSITSPEAVAELGRARAHFLSAHDRLGTRWTLPARLLPVVRRQVQSVRTVSGSAAHVADVAAGALREVQVALQAGHSTGEARVRLLERMSEIATAADRDLGVVNLGPGHLLGPVADARDRLAGEVEDLRHGLRRGAAGASAVADLLAGPRRYLVLAANNAEMRSGGGMLLSAGVLQTDGGVMTATEFRPTAELGLPPGAVPHEGDLADRWGWLQPNREWRNLGVSPRFDVTAPLAARMWEATGGGVVDGVLAVDAAALRALLSAVGPVAVEDRTVEAENVEEEVLHGQYVAHAGDDDQSARREKLGLIAGSVLVSLQARDWDASVLGRALAQAARGRHVLAWSAHPVEQQGWVAAGIDGSLRPESLLVGVLNRGGNKLDRFLDVTADLDLRPAAGRTDGVLRLRLRNDVPPGEPTYVAGPDPDSGGAEGVYVGMVAVTLPGGAGNGRVDGVSSLAVAGADGPTRVVAAPVSVARGGEQTIVVRFELPGDLREVRVEPSARLPAISWSSDGRHWRDEEARTIRW